MTKEDIELLYNMEAKDLIDELEPMLPDGLDDELTGILARVYNNDDQLQKAKALLLTVSTQGEHDSLWLYRMGYSCFYLGESELALAYLEHAKLLGSEFADELLPACKEMVMRSKPPSLDADFIAEFFAYVGCQCERIEPMEDDKSLIDKYNDACNQAEQEGFTPILILPNDTLFAQLLLNAQPENQERSRLDFSYLSVYREKMLNLSLPDGKVLLKKNVGQTETRC